MHSSHRMEPTTLVGWSGLEQLLGAEQETFRDLVGQVMLPTQRIFISCKEVNISTNQAGQFTTHKEEGMLPPTVACGEAMITSQGIDEAIPNH